MRKSHVVEEESQIDLTPLIDVVFIMLIFFIVTATFVKEPGIDVSRPDAQTAVVQEKANVRCLDQVLSATCCTRRL